MSDVLESVSFDGAPPVEVAEPTNDSIGKICQDIYKFRLGDLQKKNQKQLNELKEGLDKVSFLEKVLRKVRSETNSETGELDGSENEELQELLELAKEMGLEFENKDGKFVFNKESRDALVSNLQSLTQDCTVQNQTMLKKVERITTEMYETLKFARKTMETLHETIMKIIRNWVGR